MKKGGKILITLSLILPALVLAQIDIPNPIEAESFDVIINNIIDFIWGIALVLAPLMIVWAGILLVTAAGNSDQIRKAKNIILYTLAGFIVILLSKGLVTILRDMLGA